MSDLASLMPPLDDANRPYWEGLRARRLRLPRCEACGTFRFHHTRFCPECGSDRAAWTELSGRGRLWARCVFHQVYFEAFRERVPYGVVIVELEEGVRVYSNLADDAHPMDVPIGAPLQAEFEDISDAATLLKFRTA